MFEELNRLAGWSTEKLPERQVIYITDKGCDGSFLLHHFIALYLKAGQRVVLVSASQSLAHYSVACGRLGANLERSKSDEKLIHIDLLGAGLEEYLAEDIRCNEDLKQCFRMKTLEHLYNKVLGLIQEFGSNDKTLIVVDDLSLFVTLGFDLNDVVEFYHGMQYISRSFGASFLTLLHLEGVAEEESTLYSNCRYYGTCELKLEGLESGYSKDVHGTLTLLQKVREGLRTDFDEKVRHYKVTERGLNLFALGTSKAVL